MSPLNFIPILICYFIIVVLTSSSLYARSGIGFTSKLKNFFKSLLLIFSFSIASIVPFFMINSSCGYQECNRFIGSFGENGLMFGMLLISIFPLIIPSVYFKKIENILKIYFLLSGFLIIVFSVYISLANN